MLFLFGFTFIVLVETSQSFSALDILSHIDFKILEEKNYCEIVIDDSEFQDEYWLETVHYNQYISFNQQTCDPALVIRRFDFEFDEEKCSQRATYIKNPNVTFLFIKSGYRPDFDLLYAKLPCILNNQPYFFMMTTLENKLQVDEVQVYSKSIKEVVQFERIDHLWTIKKSWPDIYERRSNFQGSEVIAHYDNYVGFGTIDQDGNFVGYHGDIGTLVKQEFNFTFVLKPIQTYGLKKGDNDYTGTVNDLYKNKIDIAMSHFSNLPERLEVTDGAFSNLLEPPELIYHKTNDHGFIYTMVFDKMTWLVICISIALSSLVYFITTCSSNEGMPTSFLEALTFNIKAILTLDYDNFQGRRHLVSRILILTISLNGALLYWSYSGSLVSFFTVESEKPPITSFEDILNVPNLKLLMNSGNAETQYLLNAMNKDKSLKERLPRSIVWFNSSSEMYKKFMTENENEIVMFKTFIFTQVSLSREYSANMLCNIRHRMLDNVRGQELIGWLYPKNSLLKQLFDKFLTKINENGIERKLYIKYFNGIEDDQCKVTSDAKPIDFNIVVTLFKILAFGSSLAIILLCFEIVCKHFTT